jgi:hypothetical protein
VYGIAESRFEKAVPPNNLQFRTAISAAAFNHEIMKICLVGKCKAFPTGSYLGKNNKSEPSI